MQCIYPESLGVPGSLVSSEACVVIPQPPQSSEAAFQELASMIFLLNWSIVYYESIK